LGNPKEKKKIPTLLSDIPSLPFPQKICFSERPLKNGQGQKSTSGHPGFAHSILYGQNFRGLHAFGGSGRTAGAGFA
jgi:hypothetical protein